MSLTVTIASFGLLKYILHTPFYIYFIQLAFDAAGKAKVHSFCPKSLIR